MSRLSVALHNDVNALCLLRDELALQASLLSAELKDRWAALEDKFAALKTQLRHAEAAAGKSRQELEAGARLMLDTLRAGYTEIKKALGC